MPIQRHFVTVAGRWGPRQVHYRRTGSGPAVLLLHQSPQSSLEYEALMLEWAEGCTVIAPDHPGYGLSDPLVADPDVELTLDDYAEALREFMDAAGIDKAGCYGYHTGAGMAVALASAYPERVSAVYANGYVVLTESERAELINNYLPKFEPQWDGSHLTWVWTRNRDQLIFFPWYDRRLAARMFHYDMPPPEFFQTWLLEFLRAGDYYRVAYRAAFNYPGDAPLTSLEVPAIITATATDILRAHLDRITAPSASVGVRVGGTAEENIDEAHAWFFKHRGAVPAAAPETGAISGAAWNRMVDTELGQVRVRCNLDAPGRPVLLLHGAGGASDTIADVASGFAGKRPVICLDLPGHGESHKLPENKLFIDACEQAVLAVLDAFGLDKVDAWGEWGGSTVLLDLLAKHPERFRAAAASGVQLFSIDEAEELAMKYAPKLKPVWHGGHLLEYWHIMRNHSLFWPWYRQEKGAIIEAEPRVEAGHLNNRVVALMKCAADWQRICVELFCYPVDGALRDCGGHLALAAANWDPNRNHTVAAAEVTGVECARLPDDREEWADTLLKLLTSQPAR